MTELNCKGCERSAAARLAPGEVERLLGEYLASHPAQAVVDAATYDARLAACTECPDLTFAKTTCRHCGCLVAVRAKLADKSCPASTPRWRSTNTLRN